MLQVRVIGTFDIQCDGTPITLSSRAAQSLFAYLVLTAGTAHRREKLAGMFWPDAPEVKARAYIRNELWRIRKALAIQSKEEYLHVDDISVCFNPSAEYWMDFKELANLNESASIDELMAALSHCQSELLPGFYDEWLLLEREHFRATYEQKIARLLDLLERERRWQEIVEWAERWLSIGQGPEAAYRYLLGAYDALGDRAKVAWTYQQCVQALRELDLEPSEQTRALAFKQSSKIRIPIPLTSFIGREQELQEVANLLSNSRLVTLTGSGGVGKTRLAIQVVAEVMKLFPDGLWFLDLAPLSDPTLVPQAIVTTLGLIEQGGRSPATILIDFLETRRALLILDNCEHLIQACAQLSETLLRSCPGLHILATSREALRIGGELPYRVPSLEFPQRDTEFNLDELSNMESVKLFTDRAQIALPGFALNPQNTLEIAHICQRLDGIPLAIELAAARTNVLTSGQILKRLDDRFTLLSGGLRTSLPRHQTLRATIEWSFSLLSEQERILFRRLAVFAGGWTLEAAEEVCSGNDIESKNVLDLLSELVNKSLVVVENLNGEIRYRRLETIRQYAREKLGVASEATLTRQRHLDCYVALAERAEPNLRAFDMIVWLDRLEAELDNIRVALAWAQENDIESQLRLASALLWFWHIRGHKNEGIEWLERGLSVEANERGHQPLKPGRAMIRGKALNSSGFLMNMFFQLAKAPERLEESLALFRSLGPNGKQGMAYALLGLAGATQSDDKLGRSLLEHSLALFREIGDKFGVAECLMSLANTLLAEEGDYNQALILTEQQLALRREIGDQDGIATALGNLRDLASAHGDYERAIELHQESLAIFRKLGNKWAIGYGLSMFGESFLSQGDYEGAAQIYEEAWAFAHDISDGFLMAYCSYNLAGIISLQGDHVRAVKMLEDSLAVFREVDNHWMVVGALHALGDMALRQGDEKSAAQGYKAELAFAQEMQIKPGSVFARAGLGKVAWYMGDYQLATKRFEEVLRLCQDVNEKLALFHAYYGLGQVSQSQGDYAKARALYIDATQLQHLRNERPFEWITLKTCIAAIECYPLCALAALAIVDNEMERAARLLGALEHSYNLIQFQQTPVEREAHEQAIAATRAALGEETFAMLWEDGKKLTLDQAVAYAIECFSV